MWIPVSMFVDLYTFAANKTFILLHEWQCAEISKRRMCPTAYNKSLLLFCLFLMALCERAMHSSVSYSYIYYEIESIPRYPHIRWIIRKNHCFARGKMETQQKKLAASNEHNRNALNFLQIAFDIILECIQPPQILCTAIAYTVISQYVWFKARYEYSNSITGACTFTIC